MVNESLSSVRDAWQLGGVLEASDGPQRINGTPETSACNGPAVTAMTAVGEVRV